jgi:hypothetical protein
MLCEPTSLFKAVGVVKSGPWRQAFFRWCEALGERYLLLIYYGKSHFDKSSC